MADLNTPYGTRLCLSGLESRRLLETFAEFGVRHIQVSYYYLRRVFSTPEEFAEFIQGFSTVIIDSGTVYHKFKTPEEESAFRKEYGVYMGGLDKHVYTAAVYEEGADMEDNIPDDMLIYPLDIVRPIFDNDISEICKNVDWIGVGHKEAAYQGGSDLPPIFAQAKQYDTKVHIFGTSTKKILSKYPLYSCNSSSWRSGSRYLNTYIYEGGSRGIRLYQPSDKKDASRTEKQLKNIRRKQERMVQARQEEIYDLIDWGELYEGDAWEVDKANLAQWMLLQQDLELNPHNKYWLSTDETRDILKRKQETVAVKDSDPADGEEWDEEVEKRRKAASEMLGRNDEENTAIEDVDTPPVYKGGDIEGADIGEPIEPTDNAEDTQSAYTEEGDIEEGVIEGEVVEERSIDNPVNEGADIGSEPSTPPLDALIRMNSADAVAPPATTPRLRPVDDRQKQLRQCDMCILAGRCPKYAEGALCAFGLSPDNATYSHDNIERHIKEDFADLLAIQMDRVQQAALEEKIDAAGISRDLGKEISRYMEIVQLYAEAMDSRDSLEIKAKGQGIMGMFTKRH